MGVIELDVVAERSVLPKPKIAHHLIDHFPIGIISDVHGNLTKALVAMNKHPEITQWFCLGDIIDHNDRFKGNESTLAWWRDSTVPTIIGNHDRDIAAAFRTAMVNVQWIRDLPRSFKLILPDGTHYLCYHSLPDDLVTFIQPGITEREFIDQYPIDDDTRAVIIGHNHKQFKSVFYGCDSELWSVGSVGLDGQYATIDENGIQFHRVPGKDLFIK